MATTVIENLVTRFTFDFDRKKLLEFDTSFKGIIKGVRNFVAAIKAAEAGIFAFTAKIAGSNDELYKLSQRLGIDVETMQELGYVAELNGGSIGSMNSALENLSRITSQAARGIGDGVEVFGMLGLSATDASGNIKQADELMLEIADSVSRLGTQAERLEFSQRLGIGPDLLLALQQGSDAIRQQRDEIRSLGIAVDEDAGQAAANFNDAMLRTKTILKSIISTVGTRLMKIFTPMIEAFNNWFKVNKKLIQQRITSFLKGVVMTAKVTTTILIRLGRTVDGVARIMGGWQNTLAVVGAALLALNAKALAIPVLITAAAIALFLLIEDVVKFAEGGDSAIGNLLKGHENLEAALRTVLHMLKMVGKGWGLIFTQGKVALEGFVMFVRDKVAEVKKYLFSIPGMETTLKVLTSDITGVQKPVSQIPGVMQAAEQFRATNTATRTTTTGDININISGAGNPQEVARQVKTELQTIFQGAKENFRSQVTN